jgi:hypothetical protein
MMDLATISTQLEKYENKWVAIDESQEKIVGVGNDAFEATNDAERHGYPETILFKVPPFDSALILLSHESSTRKVLGQSRHSHIPPNLFVEIGR